MKSQSAFTLMEILITLAIGVILIAISLPSLKYFYDRTNDDVLQSQLLRTIQFTRSEARARGISVAMCKSKTHVSCSGNWLDGQLIFMDEYGDGVIHDKKQILMVVQTNSQQGMLYLRSYPYYRDYLVFSPARLMPSDDGTFWYCHAKNKTPIWAIMLSKSGRARVVYPQQNGELNDSKGHSLRCD